MLYIESDVLLDDTDGTRIQSGVTGVTYNGSKRIWAAKLTVDGSIRSCNWASGKYGFVSHLCRLCFPLILILFGCQEKAKRLAIIAKKEADRLGYFPRRDIMLKLYEAGNSSNKVTTFPGRVSLH